jgi:hypothetical protein
MRVDIQNDLYAVNQIDVHFIVKFAWTSHGLIWVQAGANRTADGTENSESLDC